MVAPLQKSRLGRGLASLIGEPTPSAATPAARGRAADRRRSTRSVPSRLNPRKDFREDELAELAGIDPRSKGLVQPIIVRPERSGRATRSSPASGAGARRRRPACTRVPVIVRDLIDQEVLELAIIENVQRADLNAIEEATGYQRADRALRLYARSSWRRSSARAAAMSPTRCAC